MNVSTEDLIAQFQRDWPKEFEISFRRVESQLLRQRIEELEGDDDMETVAT